MSSRIEKGGARFKPSIVPRRSASGAAAASTTASPSTSQSQTPQPSSQQQQQRQKQRQRTTAQQPPSTPQPATQSSAASTAPPPSPSLGPQTSARLARPPSIGSSSSTVPSTTASSTSTAAAIASPSVPATGRIKTGIAAPSTHSQAAASTSTRSQSFAFNASPSVIGNDSRTKPSSASASNRTNTSKTTPAFRRPSVVKPPPGSRTSLTPAPQFQQPPQSPASFSASLPHASDASTASPRREATAISAGKQRQAAETSTDANVSSEPSSRADAQPAIGGSRSATRAGRSLASSHIAPGADRTATPSLSASDNVLPSRDQPISSQSGTDLITKASQPDPIQAAPVTSSRSRRTGSSITAGQTRSTAAPQPDLDVAAVKDSASQSTAPAEPVTTRSTRAGSSARTQAANRTDVATAGAGLLASVDETNADDEMEITMTAADATTKARSVKHSQPSQAKDTEAAEHVALGQHQIDLSQQATSVNGKTTSESPSGSEEDAEDGTAEDTSSGKAVRARRKRMDTASRLAKRRLKRKEESLGKPRRPVSAYLAFVNSVRPARQTQNPDMSLTDLTRMMANEWRELSAEQRKTWEDDAARLKAQYDQDLEAWMQANPKGVELGPEDESDMETTSELDDNGEPVRRKKKRTRISTRKVHTVSDDEEEYRRQVDLEGPALAASRIDPNAVTMDQISIPVYQRGRAGPRTFEATRVYKRVVEERRANAKASLLGGHVLGDKVNAASPTPASTPLSRSTTPAGLDGDVVGIVEGEEEEEEGEELLDPSDMDGSAVETDGDVDNADGGSLSRSRRRKREPSVAATDVSFRENRFAVQTRIVDGKIVLDETSLFANFEHGEDDRDNMEVIDEREGDRFVNSSTYSRKLGRARKWTDDDTAKFYRALQQWGTDFEMIARLFPGRDRVMIKKKFNAEERSHPKLVDEAIRNTVPINLEDYARAIGVDLSGPPPEIKADLHDIGSLLLDGDRDRDAEGDGLASRIKKREGTTLAGDEGGDHHHVGNHRRSKSGDHAGQGGGHNDGDDDADADDDDDDGWEYEELVEIDDDGTEQVVRRRLGRKPGAGASSSSRKRGRNAARKNSTSTPAPVGTGPSAIDGGDIPLAPTSSSLTSLLKRGPAAPPAIGGSSTPRKSSSTRTSTRLRSSAAAAAAAATATTLDAAHTDNMEVEELVGDS